MLVIDVSLPGQPSHSYPIHIGASLSEGVAEDLVATRAPARWAVISDGNVAPLYGRPLAEALRALGADAHGFDVAAGEGSKRIDVVGDLLERLLDAGVGRDGVVVAVGGGVVGDIAGFAAATLHRGIPYVQVPTSLLAMVDSSVGGKTGVDTPQGKNLVGAFHQPDAVYVDAAALETLPDAELSAGLAEVIKYGVIDDAELFVELEDGLLDSCRHRVPRAVELVVERCVRSKAAVVAADEREADLRRVLNFGHTVAHGIETVCDYTIRHGEAVAIGMVAEARIAVELTGADPEMPERIAALCRRAELPVVLPAGIATDAVIDAARLDKKARAGQIRCALPVTFGKMADAGGQYAVEVEEGMLREALSAS